MGEVLVVGTSGLSFFFPGEWIEIEAEPERMKRPGSSSSGKGFGKGFGAPSQGGANSALELKPGHQGMGAAVGAREQLQLQEAPTTAIRHVLAAGRS